MYCIHMYKYILYKYLYTYTINILFLCVNNKQLQERLTNKYIDLKCNAYIINNNANCC